MQTSQTVSTRNSTVRVRRSTTSRAFREHQESCSLRCAMTSSRNWVFAFSMRAGTSVAARWSLWGFYFLIARTEVPSNDTSTAYCLADWVHAGTAHGSICPAPNFFVPAGRRLASRLHFVRWFEGWRFADKHANEHDVRRDLVHER